MATPGTLGRRLPALTRQSCARSYNLDFQECDQAFPNDRLLAPATIDRRRHPRPMGREGCAFLNILMPVAYRVRWQLWLRHCGVRGGWRER
jgi:hypothetical protein